MVQLAEGKELRLLGVRLYKLIEKREDIEDGRITVVDMLKRRKIEREGEVENEDEGEKREEEIVGNIEMEEEEVDDNIPKCPICGRMMQGFDDREVSGNRRSME